MIVDCAVILIVYDDVVVMMMMMMSQMGSLDVAFESCAV